MNLLVNGDVFSYQVGNKPTYWRISGFIDTQSKPKYHALKCDATGKTIKNQKQFNVDSVESLPGYVYVGRFPSGRCKYGTKKRKLVGATKVRRMEFLRKKIEQYTAELAELEASLL